VTPASAWGSDRAPLQSAPTRERRPAVGAEIVMTDGSRFVTTASTTADSLTKDLERRSFAEIELEDETIYINPAHVAYIRDV
jgi:hypothetical protein